MDRMCAVPMTKPITIAKISRLAMLSNGGSRVLSPVGIGGSPWLFNSVVTLFVFAVLVLGFRTFHVYNSDPCRFKVLGQFL